MGLSVYRIAAADRLCGEHAGNIDGIEDTQATAVFAGHFDLALSLTGSVRLLLAEQAQDFFDLLPATAAAESRAARPERADIVLGEYLVQEFVAGPLCEILRTQRFYEQAQATPVVFESRRFFRHLL